jgi:septal ring-binding cell division protein DamX
MAGKSETFIKLGLVFFISLLSFAIGTLVGKEYSDRQYKLSQLEPTEYKAEGSRSIAAVSQKENESSKLSDEEIAKLAEEFVTDDAVEIAKSTGTDKVPAIDTGLPASQSEDFAEMNDAALAAAQRIIENKLPGAASQRKLAATETEVKKASTTPLTQIMPKNAAQEDAGKYTVQVGSYVKEVEAKQRAETLKSKGYAAFYIPGIVEGKTFYRVNVGTYSTLADAKKAVEKLATENKGEKGFIKELR